MDNGEPMTFTSIALILLLLIIIVMFACHYLGPRATNWMLRSNREEKIGLSKNKLFHPNGYMMPSGSAFLLNNSGSFKRFDKIDKEDELKSAEHQHSTHATTPFWNMPATESEIPPQPLRPAPAPGKTVTFSLNNVNEIVSSNEFLESRNDMDADKIDDVSSLVPCLRAPAKKSIALPQLIDAPPPRLSSSTAATLGNTAIPRPSARRQILQQDGSCTDNERQRPHPLTRRNSSTNPFLCDSIDSATTNDNNTKAATSDFNQSPLSEIRALESHMSHTQAAKQHIKTNLSSNRDCNPFIEKVADYEPPMGKLATSENCAIGLATSVKTPASLTTTPHEKAKSLSPVAFIQQGFRDRSHSETSCDFNGLKPMSTAKDFNKQTNDTSNPFASLAQKTKRPHILQKTISEDFLFRKLGAGAFNLSNGSNCNNGQATWSFGRSLLRQDSVLSLGRRNSSQCSLDSSGSLEGLQRAESCDSVTSETSVFLCDLDQPYTQITGYLCIGLQYDYSTNEGMELLVKVIEAKELICPFSVESLDTFVRIYLVPDQAGAMQTEIYKNSQTPKYNESFKFWLKKQQGRHSLWFHLYHNGESHTLIGEAEMEIDETPRPITTWIPLSDSRKWNAQWGELMFSLSYLPTAERLTIVIVKARNLKLDIRDSQGMPQYQVQNVFVKVYLMNNEKKILKKRTSLKRKDRSLIFNESMIFSVPPQGLTTVQLRLTVFGVVDSATIVPLGHVIAGSCATGKGLRHWHQMLSSLRKPVAMWHVLRRAMNQPIFTGGAEAVVAAMQSTVALRTKRNSII